MNQAPQPFFHPHFFIPMIWVILFLLIAVVLLPVWYYRSRLGLKREAAYLLAVATMASAIGAALYVGRFYDDDDTAVICAGLLALTGIPFAAKLYLGWIGGKLTEAEKTPGAVGFRAWLTPTNLALALCVSLCAAKALDYSFAGILLLTVGALAAYPLITTLTRAAPEQPSAVPTENLTAEREKVLSMLDAGKITAEESAELLNALGSTVKSPETHPLVISSRQRIVMIGAVLVLIGFFLPWFKINPGEELNRMTQQFSGMMNQVAPQMPQMPGMPGNWNFQTPNGGQNSDSGNFTITVAGGDLSHGLGWIVLIAAIAVAVLPFVAAQLDERSRRTVCMVTLAAGSFILLYVLTQGIRFLSIGILLAAAGYIVEWIGLVKPSGAPLFPTRRRSAVGSNPAS
ncbi:MAG: hypothetical protein ABSE62_10035 [Chthoniobacteraceae bacterium]|jgi:hypothetical protein